MLKKGGNAVDAAIATQLALAVVYPGAGNLGGGGFMVLNIDGKKTAIDFRETAPSRSTADMYVDKATGKANTHLSQEGPLSCGVPGTVAGLFAAMKYAKLPFRTLIEPAITLAERGFILSESEAASLDSAKAAFERNNTTRPAFVKAHGWWAEGDTLIQPDLAQTLKRIRDNGKDGFYKGETARLITTQMERSGGIISAKDLARYEVIERKPQQFGYRGYQIVTMPLPGSGGILLEQMLKMLEQKPLSQYGFCNTKTVQLITEVERRAYADRSEYLGDPDYYKVPAKKLVSPQYLLQRMADYDSTHAGSSDHTKPGNLKESNETTHLSIIDKDGNCASVTTTLNGWYGSKCVVADAGFLLNDEMDDFSAQPGVPNQFGAIGGDANAIAPGKRMLSSMSPTIVFKNGKPFMIVGSPGGTTIITSVLQSIIDVIDFGMSAPAAVNGPKFHHQWLPDEIYVEKNFPDDVRHQLRQMGYKVTERGPWSRTELIKLQYGNTYEAAADGRGGMDDVAAW
jgi:gamma-glutamyltranspeptidase/glutathione hydrolase